jgi:hypothetical protein
MLGQTEHAYQIHTNRELEFMLSGGKPLPHFCEPQEAHCSGFVFLVFASGERQIE